MDMRNGTAVFVYGSLMTDFWNRRLMRNAKVRPGATNGTMFSLGSFPGIFDIGDGAVRGEFAVVNDAVLDALDYLEGNGRFYTRVLKRVVLDDGEEREAWIYCLPINRLREARGNWTLIPDGDWRRFQNERGHDDAEWEDAE